MDHLIEHLILNYRVTIQYFNLNTLIEQSVVAVVIVSVKDEAKMELIGL